MLPLADLHIHLLAGLDDGPRTDEDAVALCRMAYEQGARLAAATAHQNDRWCEVTPDRIRQATERLSSMLHDEGIHLKVFPCAEAMVHPDIETSWRNGDLMSMADRGQYLLIELPHGMFVDLRYTIQQLRQAGVRPILAHPERSPELLHEPGAIEELIHIGCLVQVSTHSITDPPAREDERALKGWFQRGIVHVLGTDAHSPRRRPPRMREAYERIVRWAGPAVADRVASTNGMAILQGLPLKLAQPQEQSATWFSRLWHG